MAKKSAIAKLASYSTDSHTLTANRNIFKSNSLFITFDLPNMSDISYCAPSSVIPAATSANELFTFSTSKITL
ncbi:unknown [Salmonella phage FelixO1]|uniref:Uncharacterized protein n=1 Tax=Salmonella phage Felix O1 (isolate Felix O1-VT1) TaxID=1283336 RepID=Q6KGR1_BPFO1|nr:unknown [Salmonella phage FelixO1]